ncbi:MAG: YciI family protein [Aphanocapsa sp. GSE-SYN-MK-11-07L]|nr:YciI family protein [Aphanocapsa sp. GSE-SYN-MK-11-07L]
MKFICLGYRSESKWDELPERDRTALIEKCFAYDDELRRGGHFIGGEALQTVRNAATLRHQKGKVIITDGPYAETKEQLGGFLILEARDLNHAIQLMSKHPGVHHGLFELRPVDEQINLLATNFKSAA